MRANQYSAASGSDPRRRFMQGRDEVVVLLPVLVVQRRSLGQQLRQRRRVERRRSRRQRLQLLGHVQQITPVPVRHRPQHVPRDPASAAAATRPLRLRPGRAAGRAPPRPAAAAPAPGNATVAPRSARRTGSPSSHPTSTTVPSSTTGRKPSCCARLNRWISSTNSSVA